VFFIDRKKNGYIALVLIILIIGIWGGYTISHSLTPVRVGVLLSMTGDLENREPLEWAQENINQNGGIGGRPLELVYKDTAKGDTLTLAKELLADGTIHVVIGPDTSDDTYTLAPLFAEKNKILISPYATSGDLYRAFGKSGTFWRTTQGDVAQIKTILSILKSRNAGHVALLVENTSYGDTFYDWTGFFAIEYGINLTSIQQFERETGRVGENVDLALAQDPDYIIAICGPVDAATIKQAMDRSGTQTKLFLADSAASPLLVSQLGRAAEGMEGTTPTADPASGFASAYQEKFGHAPSDFAAPIYDALLLAAATEARQDAVFSEIPADSLRHVVYGNGTLVGWNATGIHDALKSIRSGGSPDLSGASGPLRYDAEYGVDPLVAYYSIWVVENGTLSAHDVIGSEKTGSAGVEGVSASGSRATRTNMGSATSGTSRYTPLTERKDFQAVIVGSSRGWNNYRHQSDALAVYALLRKNGVQDDHIILMLYDDIPNLPENPIKGDVHNTLNGINLRSGARTDYTGRQVTAETFENVMLGNLTADTPVVLESNTSTDVFVYIASHGTPGRTLITGSTTSLTTEEFTNLTNRMEREGKYRQIVYLVETCFSEGIARNSTAKGMLYLTGASATEPSLGAVYDMGIKQWLSDEFTATFLNVIRTDPDITFRELYITTYERVTGSHVRMLNTENFGNIDIPVREYLTP